MSWSIVAHFAPWLTLALVLAVASLVWHAERARRRGHVRPYVHSATQHKASHSVAAVVGVVAFVVILLAGNAALTRSTGARFDRHRFIKALFLPAGGGQLPASVDLSNQLPSVVVNQGNTNSCCGWTAVDTDYAGRIARLEQVPEQFSGFYTYRHTPSGAYNGYTSLDDEVNSINAYCTVPLSLAPSFLGYDQGPVSSSGACGASLTYLYYQWQGWDSDLAIMEALASGHMVAGLFQENTELTNDFWTNSTMNSGSQVGTHCMKIYKYSWTPGTHEVTFYVANTWGPSFGENGRIAFLPGSAHTIVAAGVITPGTPYWPIYHPQPVKPVLPIPTARPTATTRPTATATRRPTATPRPKPTATPRPKPTATPRPKPTVRPTPAVLYRVTVASTLRAGEGVGTAHVRDGLVKVGWQLRYLGKRSPHWVLVERLDHHAHGYIAVDHVALVRHR